MELGTVKGTSESMTCSYKTNNSITYYIFLRMRDSLLCQGIAMFAGPIPHI